MVFKDAKSDPEPGSEYPWHHQTSLLSIEGKNFSFCNHLLVDFESEPQMISREFIFSEKKEDENEILNEVKNLSDEHTYFHSWKKNDFIMLDNKRFMHGRASFDSKIERDISQIQTNIASFPYGKSTRTPVNSNWFLNLN